MVSNHTLIEDKNVGQRPTRANSLGKNQLDVVKETERHGVGWNTIGKGGMSWHKRH